MFFRVDVSPPRVPTHHSPLSQTYAQHVWQILAAEENPGTTWRAAARAQDRATAYARGSSDQSPSVVHF